MPECSSWDDRSNADQTATWSDRCSDGLAEGFGTLKWVWGDAQNEHSGVLRDARNEGHWLERYASGIVTEGLYVEGGRHGHLVEHQADGDVAEGPWVKGDRHGDSVLRRPAGTTVTLAYVNGELQ